MTSLKPIETIYKGYRFRSRLEARWAVMFDLLHWNFEYEPFDLMGWTPDFVIYGDQNVLVEIKPSEMVDKNVVDKITKAGENRNIIVLTESNIDNQIGYEIKRKDVSETDNGMWALQLKDYPDGTYDIGSLGQFDGMLYNKSEYRKFFIKKDDFDQLWNIAGNEVMFLKPIMD